MPFSLTGVGAMAAKIRRVEAGFRNEVARALYREAQIEMTESKRRVPVEYGILRASGHVQEPVWSGKSISVTLAYGGEAEAYAVIVHEDLEALHPRGGQAKYLESVLKESQPHMKARVARRINLNNIARGL